MENHSKEYYIEDLRKRALQILSQKSSSIKFDKVDSELVVAMQELEVHIVELELHMEDYSKLKSELEDVKQKYEELYDLHNRFILHIVKSNNSNQ